MTLEEKIKEIETWDLFRNINLNNPSVISEAEKQNKQ